MISSTHSTNLEAEAKQPTSPFTPQHIDNTVIQYFGNKAELLSALYECEQFYKLAHQGWRRHHLNATLKLNL